MIGLKLPTNMGFVLIYFFIYLSSFFHKFIYMFVFIASFLGPRYCIGKYVADMFMYALVANILQNFNITTKNPEQPLSFENAFSSFGLQPLHFSEIKLEPLE